MKLNISCASVIYPVEVDVNESVNSNNNNNNNINDKDSSTEQQSTSLQTDNANPDGADGTISTLGLLKRKISTLCSIEPVAMKILHRGRILNNDDSTPLSSFNFKENDKLLILGKPPPSQEDNGYKLLLNFEIKSIKDMRKSFMENSDDLNRLELNYLKDPERREQIRRMEKRMKCFVEKGLKNLETLDDVEIVTDKTTEKQALRNRDKRKSLVDEIQDALNKNDKLMARLDEYRYKCEHPEEGL